MKIYRRKHKSGSASWWLDFTVNGKRYRRPTGASSRKTAQEAADRIAVAIASGTWEDTPEPVQEPEPGILFEKAVGAYLKDREKNHGRSLASYYALTPGGAWRQVFDGRELASITAGEIHEHAQRWLHAKARAKRRSPATVCSYLAQLSGLLTWAMREPRGYVATNEARKVERPKVDNVKTRWLRPSEVEAVVEACPEWLREIVIFAALTGMRRGEIAKVAKRDFQRDAHGAAFLIVQRTKNGRAHAWPLAGEALRIVEQRVKVLKFEGAPIFPAAQGGDLHDNLSRAFRRAVERAGLVYGRDADEGVTFHSLRKTMASLLLNAGVSPAVIMRAGNWRSDAMLRRYAHLGDTGLREAAEQLDNLLGFASRHAGGTQAPKTSKNVKKAKA